MTDANETVNKSTEPEIVNVSITVEDRGPLPTFRPAGISRWKSRGSRLVRKVRAHSEAMQTWVQWGGDADTSIKLAQRAHGLYREIERMLLRSIQHDGKHRPFVRLVSGGRPRDRCRPAVLVVRPTCSVPALAHYLGMFTGCENMGAMHMAAQTLHAALNGGPNWYEERVSERRFWKHSAGFVAPEILAARREIVLPSQVRAAESSRVAAELLAEYEHGIVTPSQIRAAMCKTDHESGRVALVTVFVEGALRAPVFCQDLETLFAPDPDVT